MPGKRYVGKAGDLAVMSEFLYRGYNVAIPEVDVGDDVFVVHDREGDLYRIQVKTATGIPRKQGYSGKYSIPLKQLETPSKPDLDYVLALRKGVGQWEFLVISREPLYAAHVDHPLGAVVEGNLILYVSFRDADVVCANRSFQQYRNNWNRWPILGP